LSFNINFDDSYLFAANALLMPKQLLLILLAGSSKLSFILNLTKLKENKKEKFGF